VAKKIVTKETPAEKSKISVRDFIDFMKNTSALGLAIAVVTADAVNKLVNSIVNGVLTPFLSIFLPKAQFDILNFTLFGSKFKFGEVATALLNFLVVSVVIYFMVKVVFKKEDMLPATLKKSSVKVESSDK
jgi:large conductance mechanosensitive channel